MLLRKPNRKTDVKERLQENIRPQVINFQNVVVLKSF